MSSISSLNSSPLPEIDQFESLETELSQLKKFSTQFKENVDCIFDFNAVEKYPSELQTEMFRNFLIVKKTSSSPDYMKTQSGALSERIKILKQRVFSIEATDENSKEKITALIKKIYAIEASFIKSGLKMDQPKRYSPYKIRQSEEKMKQKRPMKSAIKTPTPKHPIKNIR